MLWECFGNALKMLWECFGMLWECFGSALGNSDIRHLEAGGLSGCLLVFDVFGVYPEQLGFLQDQTPFSWCAPEWDWRGVTWVDGLMEQVAIKHVVATTWFLFVYLVLSWKFCQCFLTTPPRLPSMIRKRSIMDQVSVETSSSERLSSPQKHLWYSFPQTPSASASSSKHAANSSSSPGKFLETPRTPYTPYPLWASDSPSNPFGWKRREWLLQTLPDITCFLWAIAAHGNTSLFFFHIAWVRIYN